MFVAMGHIGRIYREIAEPRLLKLHMEPILSKNFGGELINPVCKLYRFLSVHCFLKQTKMVWLRKE